MISATAHQYVCVNALGHRVADLQRQVLTVAPRPVSDPPPPPRRSVSATVRTTDMTAVPIEAPTCWMMFSVVEARATWIAAQRLHRARHQRHHREAHADAHHEQDRLSAQ